MPSSDPLKSILDRRRRFLWLKSPSHSHQSLTDTTHSLYSHSQWAHRRFTIDQPLFIGPSTTNKWYHSNKNNNPTSSFLIITSPSSLFRRILCHCLPFTTNFNSFLISGTLLLLLLLLFPLSSLPIARSIKCCNNSWTWVSASPTTCSFRAQSSQTPRWRLSYPWPKLPQTDIPTSLPAPYLYVVHIIIVIHEQSRHCPK